MSATHANANGRAVRAMAAVLAIGALVAAAAGCEGERGDPSRYFAIVQVTSDVIAADLSELGITQDGDLPESDDTQELTSRSGRVFWTSNWEGSDVQYLATVSLKKSKGDKGDSGLFPANDAVDLPPLTADVGDDGEDITLRFLIRRDELHVFRAAEPRQGTPVD